ncbi:DUF3519 domain-containing protein, partial [Helicobacter pylori]|uniref:DUF3519 domain-containing protein n=1 Tax=Helicobacter pylori TaxID=210 RepID=UPI0036F1DBEA
KGIKKQKLETPSEWGHHYSEFKGDGLGAINKLLETKKGFVAGAFHKEGLGDIDLVWGNKDYGLEHILKRRIESYIKKGLKPKFAEQRALNLVRMMPEVIEKGKVGKDDQGRLKIETNDILVALRDNWQGEPLKNKWVITGFEKKVGNIGEQAKFIDPSLITKDGEHLASSLNSVEPNFTTNALKKQESEQARAEKLRKLESEKGIKKQKLETPSEWGHHYSEFKGDGLGAINKLLETKKGFVAGAFHKEGLGDIDLVWGNKDYGLEHILKRREDQALNNGINETEAKKYAMSVVKTIPEVIEKGVKVERNGRVAIEYQNIRVGLKDNWKGEKLPNHWVITGYEKRSENSESLYTSPLITKGETLPLNSNEPNPTTNMLKTQEPLSEQANAKKLAKLESEKRVKAEALKKLNFDEIKKLIDESPNNGKDIIVIGDDNLTPEIVEYIHKKHAKVGIERLDKDEITAFNSTYPKNAKAIIDYQGIQHALNKHGINSPSVKFSKQPPITYKDIANYRDIVKNADETIKRDNRIISYKQVNGHFVVVEQINRNKSEFIFKTMFKEKGDYKNASDYKKNIKEND